MSLPWFRMWAEFATDPVVQSLAFDDQRHFVMLLCLKCSGVLDKQFGDDQCRTTVIRKTLGLDGKAWDEMRHRLMAMNLITPELHPKNWDKRQYVSDTSAERTRKWREKKRHSDVTVTPPDTDNRLQIQKKSKSASRSRTPPPDFTISEKVREWASAECPGVDLTRELSKFLDHEFNTPRSDWEKCFRNWIRTASERAGGSNGKRLSVVERVNRATGGARF